MLSDLDQLPRLVFGDFVLQFELDDDLKPEVREKARKELREVDENVRNGIEELRNLLRGLFVGFGSFDGGLLVFLDFLGETDLRVPLEKDVWLIRFLRPCKFYPESAFELVSISISKSTNVTEKSFK